MALFGFTAPEQLRQACRSWVEEALWAAPFQRDGGWTESLAIGRPRFVEQVKESLGVKARHREIVEQDGGHVLREDAAAYMPHLGHEKFALSEVNTVIWAKN